MVTKDVSRFLVQQQKHYVGARLQQGRVLLDSDFNEGVELGREDQRRVLVDVIGPAGSPNSGFSIRRPLDTPANESTRLGPGTELPPVSFGEHTTDTARQVHPVTSHAGSLYIGGLRFDLEDRESILFQRDFLQLRPRDLPDFTVGSSARLLYFLRGFEQCVSALEDQELGEAMLKGADSSLRVRRMRRVEVLELTTAVANCDQAWSALRGKLETDENGTFDKKSFELVSNGRLRLSFVGGVAEDSCAPSDPFGKRYLGAENQTLRVLLTARDKFVWSLDNPRLFRARVLGLDQAAAQPKDVRVELLDRPSEERDWPFLNRVVEIIPFGALLEGAEIPGPVDPHYRKMAAEVGVFTRALETFDPARGSFTVDQGDPATKPILAALQSLVHSWPISHPLHEQLNVTDPDGARFFYVRLWHQAPTRAEVELPTATAPVLGTTGIRPSFVPGQRGDFWIATLRPEAAKEILPFELLQEGGALPSGPRRFFAPLAFVEYSGDTVVSAEDCRPRIRPLNNRLCTKLIVGDGIHSFGDFFRIGDALAALPRSGGIISVRPGVYRESLGIFGRDDVTIEGCGPSTIIQTNDATVPVIQIGNANRIALRSVAIQTQGGAVQVASSSEVALVDLHLASGDFGGINQAFRPGVAESDFTQLSFSGVDVVSLRDCVLRPNRQRGVALADCRNVTIERVQATGADSPGQRQEAPPMFEFLGVTGVVMREASLRVFTQIGVRIGANAAVNGASCSELEFSELEIEAGGVQEDVSRRPPILTPFDLDDVNAAGIRLRRSRISMHLQFSAAAAISLLGQRVTVEHNRVSCERDTTDGPLAWGGIHVRGGSNAVTVRHNFINGGAGHGITLGSVRYEQEGRAARPSLPGQTQLASDGSAVFVTGLVSSTQFDDGTGSISYFVVDEGLVSDVVLADNKIEGFSTNGIAAFGVLGIDSHLLLEVTRVRIERNLIRDNVRRPQPDMASFSALPFPTSRKGANLTVSVLPLGGVVLANGQNIEITDNQIIDNGQTDQAIGVPLNGVFVLAGDAISIEGNRIANNGRRLDKDDPPLLVGVRAGIAVLLAGTSSVQNDTEKLNDLLFQPPTELDNRGVALRVVNNTVRHPEGRALFAVVMGPVSIDGNYLASQGNHKDPVRRDQFAIGDVVYVQDLGAPWESFQFRHVVSPPGTSAEFAIELTPHLSPIMLSKVVSSPRWFTGLGGGILFVNNQVVYDWTIQRSPTEADAPLSYFPNVLLGLDHTTVVGNQFAVRLNNLPADFAPPHPATTAPLFATLLAAGVTTNIELNRCSETIGSTFLSVLGNGDVMNITTLNQTTHRVASTVTVRTLTQLISKDNLVLVQPPNGPSHDALVATVKDALQEFLRLTFRPR